MLQHVWLPNINRDRASDVTWIHRHDQDHINRAANLFCDHTARSVGRDGNRSSHTRGENLCDY